MTGHITTGLMSSNTDEWGTPQALYDLLDSEFHFTLDPCATDQNHKAPVYFTKEQDGLRQDWGTHTVFINPPYGRSIGQWVKKALEHSQGGAFQWPCYPVVHAQNGGAML